MGHAAESCMPANGDSRCVTTGACAIGQLPCLPQTPPGRGMLCARGCGPHCSRALRPAQQPIVPPTHPPTRAQHTPSHAHWLLRAPSLPSWHTSTLFEFVRDASATRPRALPRASPRQSSRMHHVPSRCRNKPPPGPGAAPGLASDRLALAAGSAGSRRSATATRSRCGRST